MDNLTIILIMITVMIVIPIIFARISGKNPMEVFFGSRVKGSAFDKGGSGQAQDTGKSRKEEKNSNRNELLVVMSDMTSYARRNRFYIIMPGTLQCKGKMAHLAAVIITRGSVIGVNCFGFGGSITAGSGKDDWSQTINGEKKKFTSPVVKNREQEAILRGVLDDAGFKDVNAKVVGAFTASNVKLTGAGGTGCYDRNGLKRYLASNECMVSRDLTPSEIGKKLEPYVRRQGK